MALVLSRKESGSSSACRAKDQSEASISRQPGPMRAHLEASHVVDDEDLPEDADQDPAQGEDGLGLQLQGELGDQALQETWRGGDRYSCHPTASPKENVETKIFVGGNGTFSHVLEKKLKKIWKKIFKKNFFFTKICFSELEKAYVQLFVLNFFFV